MKSSFFLVLPSQRRRALVRLWGKAICNKNSLMFSEMLASPLWKSEQTKPQTKNSQKHRNCLQSDWSLETVHYLLLSTICTTHSIRSYTWKKILEKWKHYLLVLRVSTHVDTIYTNKQTNKTRYNMVHVYSDCNSKGVERGGCPYFTSANYL